MGHLCLGDSCSPQQYLHLGGFKHIPLTRCGLRHRSQYAMSRSGAHSQDCLWIPAKLIRPDLVRAMAASFFSMPKMRDTVVAFFPLRPAKVPTALGRSRAMSPALHLCSSARQFSRPWISQSEVDQVFAGVRGWW